MNYRKNSYLLYLIIFMLACGVTLSSWDKAPTCNAEVVNVYIEDELTDYYIGCTDDRNEKLLDYVDQNRGDLVFWLQHSDDHYVLRLDKGFDNMKAQFNTTDCQGELDVMVDFYAYSPTKDWDEADLLTEISGQKNQFSIDTDVFLKWTFAEVGELSEPYAIRFSNKERNRLLYMPINNCSSIQDSLTGKNWQMMKIILGDNFRDFENRDFNVEEISGDFIENFE